VIVWLRKVGVVDVSPTGLPLASLQHDVEILSLLKTKSAGAILISGIIIYPY
jgi:hypothetical protein